MGVPRAPVSPVPVEVDTGWTPGVGRCGETVGIGRIHCAKRLGQRGQGHPPGVEIHVQQEKHIGIRGGNHLERRENLGVVPVHDVPKQQAGTVPRHRSVKDGEAKGIRGDRRGEGD
jgi:hypothetical protein